jgi:RNA polymerase sigma factor (sigma-70 family)
VKVTQQSELRLQVGGTVNPRTGVYIVRSSDDKLLQLLERGEYANVLCSRQMGKSSLLMRTKSRLAKKGYATAAIDVAGHLGSSNDSNEWYQGLLDEIAQQLCLGVNITEWWGASRAITPNQRLIQFFRDEIVTKRPEPVVIFLDEIDSTHKLPYADDFFVAIRAMYNDRASEALYDRITFCLAGVATPNELIKDRRTTPYNIGRTIELQDFDLERDDLSPLSRAIADNPITGEAIIQSVMRWTGGHPYLTVRLCDQLVAEGRTLQEEVDRVIEEEFASLDQLHSDVHFQQVLRFLDERVEDKLAALTLYQQLRNGKKLRDQTTPEHIALRLAGIVKRDQRGYLIVRNLIYARVFTGEWAAKVLEADTHPFNKLLELLAPDRDLAGEEYERLRRALVKFFLARRCQRPEDLADQTFDRVADRIEKGEEIQNLAAYCFGLARRLAIESLKRESKQNDATWELDRMLEREEAPADRREEEYECLEHCLQKLSQDNRELLLQYYRGVKRTKIDSRSALAKRLGYSPNTLRVRVYRLRATLEDCIQQCLYKKEGVGGLK